MSTSAIHVKFNCNILGNANVSLAVYFNNRKE